MSKQGQIPQGQGTGEDTEALSWCVNLTPWIHPSSLLCEGGLPPLYAQWTSADALQPNSKATFPSGTTLFSTARCIHLLPLLGVAMCSCGCTSTADQWLRGKALVRQTWSKSQLCHWQPLWPWASDLSLRVSFRFSHMQKGQHNEWLWSLIWDPWGHLYLGTQIFLDFSLPEQCFIGNRLCNPLSGVWDSTLKSNT